MRYSIQDEDLNRIISLENEVSDNIEELYNEYAESIIQWGQKFNSELVYSICKKTIGMIDDDYFQAIRNFASQYAELGTSFESISRHYRVGDDALGKVTRFQSEILERALLHNVKEIQYTYNGDAQYSNELINEYKAICTTFISKLEASYDEYSGQARSIREENLLGDGIDVLIKYQYETLQKVCILYDKIFETFLEWYERTLRENEALLESLNQQMLTLSADLGEEEIEKLISQIIDEGTVSQEAYMGNSGETSNGINGSNNAQNVVENPEEKKREAIKKASQKAMSASLDSLLKELDTPEKIKDFKEYIATCQSKFNECKVAENKEGQKSKFKQFCDFIKKGAKKYAKPIAKALGIIVPLIAPEACLVAKIAKALPSVMDCFSDVPDAKKDIDKVELGLECIKSIGVQNFPEEPEKIKKYVEERATVIADDILKKILSSEKFLKVLDIDEKELSKPQNREIYKKYTGKEVARVPQKKKAYDYDFEQYDPKKLNQLQPQASEERVNALLGDIKTSWGNGFDSKTFEQIMKEVQALKKELDSAKAYVAIEPNSELKRIIEELRSIIKSKTQDEYLEDYDGRFNKEELRLLIEEFEAERERSTRNNQQPDYSNACSNFLRRHMGYPAQEEKMVVVKSMQELIPVINARTSRFRVENEYLVKTINAAQNLSSQKNSKIKKKGILKTLWDNATILGGTLGIGTLLAMGGCWPLGLLYTWGSIGCVLEDSQSTAYTDLVYQLGDKRTDCLLENYHNIEKDIFELKK